MKIKPPQPLLYFSRILQLWGENNTDEMGFSLILISVTIPGIDFIRYESYTWYNVT